MYKPHSRTALLVIMLLALVSCARFSDQPGPAPERYDANSLSKYVASCKKSLSSVAPARLAYPRSIDAVRGNAVSYEAAVDVTGNPPPATEQIDAVDPAVVPVTVQCVIGARLVAVGDVTIAPSDASGDAGWVYQKFPPGGVVEWSWTITPNSRGEQAVRLEFRPAAARSNNAAAVIDFSAQGAYTTTVHASGNWLDAILDWFNRYLKEIETTVIAAGVSALAIWAAWRPLIAPLIKKLKKKHTNPTNGAD